MGGRGKASPKYKNVSYVNEAMSKLGFTRVVSQRATASGGRTVVIEARQGTRIYKLRHTVSGSGNSRYTISSGSTTLSVRGTKVNGVSKFQVYNGNTPIGKPTNNIEAAFSRIQGVRNLPQYKKYII